MVNFRYHLASLVAVFIALGIGMLIGNSFVGLASVEAQTPLLKRLQGQVADVREQVQVTQRENAALKDRMNDRDRAFRAMAPRMVDGLLQNRRVALVVIGQPERAESVTELSNILAAAGAERASVTRIGRDWLPQSPEQQAQLLQRMNIPPAEDSFAEATAALGNAIIAGGWTGALNDAAQLSDDLELDGDYSQPVGAVVLITSASGSEEALAAQSEASVERILIQAWKDAGIRIVAAEPEDSPASLISFFRNHDVPTVDNIDTAMGQVACVMALAVGEGHYGTKETADRLLPDLAALPPASP